MANKIIANIGYFQGYNGKGILYVGKTEDGEFFAAMQVVEGSETGWQYVRKSRFLNMIVDTGSGVVSDFNQSLLVDTLAPSFSSGTVDGFPKLTVSNGGGLPRLYNYEDAYTLKGTGVTDAELKSVKNTITTTPTTGGTKVGLKLIPTTAAEWATATTDPLGFLTTYWVIPAAAVVLWIFFTKSGRKFGRKLGLVKGRK